MFAELISILNQHKTMSHAQIREHLLNTGYLVKDSLGNIYDATTAQYLAKLKKSNYISYESTDEINLLKKIPQNLRTNF